MATGREALVERARAMLEQGGDLVRNGRLKETVVLLGCKLRAFEECNRLIQNREITAAFDVMGGGVRQPRPIVGNSGADALPRMGQPPMLNVALDELPPGRP